MGAFVVATRLVPQLSRYQRYYVLSAAGSMFWLWFPVLAAGQALFNNRLRPLVRLVAGGLALAALGYSVSGAARDWASGWLPPLVAMGVLIWLRWPRLSIGLGVAAFAVAMLNFPLVQQFILSPDNEYSLFTRQAATEIVWQIALVSPLLGVGPANYYWYTPLFPILGYYVNFNSHNQYVDLMAQVGLLGIVFYFWFFLAAARTAWRLRPVPDGHARAYANACLAGIAGTLVAGALGDWVLPFVYNVGISGFRSAVLPWLFLGGLVVVERIYLRSGGPQPASDAARA
jgi:O-antigen ligase